MVYLFSSYYLLMYFAIEIIKSVWKNREIEARLLNDELREYC